MREALGEVADHASAAPEDHVDAVERAGLGIGERVVAAAEAVVAQLAELDACGGKRRGDLVERDGVRVVVADEKRVASEADDFLGAVFEQTLLHAEAAAAEEERGVLPRWERIGRHGRPTAR